MNRSKKTASRRMMSPALLSFLDYYVGRLDAQLLAETVLPYLLDAAIGPDTTMKEKIAALKAVESASETAASEKAARQAVLSRTASLLDHRKRLVRKAAADARNAWFLAA